MLLKRQHNTEGRCTHVQIQHTGIAPEQNFSRRLVLDAVTAGWMNIEGDRLRIKAEPQDLAYTINREPGYYCISSGQSIPIGELAWSQLVGTGQGVLSRKEALAWLAANGKREDDYAICMAYECVLDPEHHEAFKATAKGVH